MFAFLFITNYFNDSSTAIILLCVHMCTLQLSNKMAFDLDIGCTVVVHIDHI